MGGNDEGIWRRLIVIPFKAKIAKRNDIKNYAQYLTEQAGPAVLQWIIEGAQRIIQQNYQLITPAAVAKAVKAYHADKGSSPPDFLNSDVFVIFVIAQTPIARVFIK